MFSVCMNDPVELCIRTIGIVFVVQRFQECPEITNFKDSTMRKGHQRSVDNVKSLVFISTYPVQIIEVVSEKKK